MNVKQEKYINKTVDAWTAAGIIYLINEIYYF